MISEEQLMGMTLPQIEYYINGHPEEGMKIASVLTKLSIKMERNYIKSKFKGEY